MAYDRFDPPPKSDFSISPTAEDVARFREDGFVVVERLTTDEELDWLTGLYEHIFAPEQASASGAPMDRSGSAPAEEPRLRQMFFPETHFPELLQTTYLRNARRFAAALLGVPESAVGSWGHMIHKPPGGREVKWHQDRAYWRNELDYHALGVWLPLHDVTVEMGAMQFMPGSHKRGLLPHQHFDELRHHLLVVAEEIDTSKAVACPLKRGGATIHDMHTLHFTMVNKTDRPRLAYPVEFETAPVRRKTLEKMPWKEEYDRAIGERPLGYMADGKWTAL